MDPSDAEKTTSLTPMGIFHYIVMSFGLKNGDATYQRAMTVMFYEMLHNCLDDYVDDIFGKSKEECHNKNDLRKVLTRCRQYNLRMSPRNVLSMFL